MHNAVLIGAALAAVAMGSPVAAPETQPRGLAMPYLSEKHLERRATGGPSLVDYARERQSGRIKLSRGAQIHEQNTGTKLAWMNYDILQDIIDGKWSPQEPKTSKVTGRPLVSANVSDNHLNAPLDSALEPVNATQSNSTQAQAGNSTVSKRQSTYTFPANIQLTNHLSDYGYFTAPAGFGSRRKAVDLNWDTGSGDTWVPGTGFRTWNLPGGETYDPKNSKTVRNINKNYGVEYGTGFTGYPQFGPLLAHVDVYQDTVHVGGPQDTNHYVTNFNFGVTSINAASQPLNHQTLNGGVMALSFQSLSSINAPTFVESLHGQGRIPHAEFALDLKNNYIYLGYHSTFKADIAFLPIEQGQSYWATTQWGISINGDTIIGGPDSLQPVIFDSGVTPTTVPFVSAERFFANYGSYVPVVVHVPGVLIKTAYWLHDCNEKFAGAEIFYGSKKFAFRDFITPLGKLLGQCVSGVMTDFQEGSDLQAIIVGQSFLRNVYSVFSYENLQIGLGNYVDNTNNPYLPAPLGAPV